MGKKQNRELVIRTAGEADLDSILQIEERCYPDPWERETFREILAAGVFAVSCAQLNGRVVGFFVCRYSREGWAELSNLAVDPDFHNRGFGGLLLDEFMLLGVAKGCLLFVLQVRPGNISARRLYEARGFRVEKRLPGYYADGEDALLMICRLHPSPAN